MSMVVFPGLNSLCQLLGCLCPGYGLCGSPWGVPLVGLLLVPWLWACLFWFPWLPMPGPWAGFWLVSPLSECGLDFIWLVCLLACMWGLVLVCISFAWGMGLVLFGLFAC